MPQTLPTTPAPAVPHGGVARGHAIELVAIGTSAGGVEALGVLLAALPAGCRAAVMVVLHLPPDRSSLLPSLYAARCPLPLKEVEDKEPVSGGTVYFAAPDYHMQVEPERRFSLALDAPVHYSRPSIDVALESAALAYHGAMLGIILTGASADGAAGLAAVRRHGGLGWVQDPALAQAAIMPAAALARAGADLTGSVAEIAAALALLLGGGPAMQDSTAGAKEVP